MAVLCMLYKIRCNQVNPLNGAIPRPYFQCVLHAVLWLHIGILMRSLVAEPCSTTGLLFSSQCLSETISLTSYSIVWDWQVLREGLRCFYIGLSCSILTKVFYYFSLSLLSVYRLVLWGRGLRTDRECITFSQPCTADIFY